jgi:hypothetical protein
MLVNCGCKFLSTIYFIKKNYVKAENEEAMNKMEDDRENALHEAKTAMSKIIRLENALNIKDEEYDKLSKRRLIFFWFNIIKKNQLLC